jgi:hypothetical protein
LLTELGISLRAAAKKFGVGRTASDQKSKSASYPLSARFI